MFNITTNFDETAFNKKDLPLPISPRTGGIRPFQNRNQSTSLKWMALGGVFFLMVLWRNASISARMEQQRTGELVADLIGNMESIVQAKSEEKDVANMNAKYWEGVVDGMAQSPEGMSRRVFSQERNDSIREQKKSQPHSIEEVLNTVEDTVKSAVKSTIDTLKDALDIKHVDVSQEDKDETAAKLIEVAVALEIAAEKLNLEAHAIVGDKKADEITEDAVIEAIVNDDDITSELVDVLLPDLIPSASDKEKDE